MGLNLHRSPATWKLAIPYPKYPHPDLLRKFALEKLQNTHILTKMHTKYQETRWEGSKITWKQQLEKMQPPH